MKIAFGLTQDFLCQCGYSIKDQSKMLYEKYAFCFREIDPCWEIEPVNNKIKYVKNIINSNFKSIFWKKIEWGWTFDFKDKADEAYFLLWSSQGVEI